MNILSKRFALPHLYQPVSGDLKLWISGRAREGYGTRIPDLSGNGNSGEIIGASWTNTPLNHPCLSFDGVDDYIEIPTISFSATEPWTLETWVKWNGDPGGDYIGYVGRNAGNGNFMLKYVSNNRFTFRASNNLYYSFSSGSSNAIIDKWTQLIWIADGAGNLAIYLDGLFLETIAVTGTTAIPFSYIGRGEASNRWAYGGLMDEVRIYNRALGADEVMEHYNDTKYLFGY